MTILRPNFTPKAGRSRSCPCPAGVQAWSACSIPAQRRGACGDDRRGTVARDRAPRPFAARQDERRTRPWRFPACGRDGATLCARSHRAGRRGGARGAADRRAGAQSRPARRRHHRRDSWPRRDGKIVDVGAPDVLARYDTQRRADVTSRTIAVDLFNRSLLTDFLPAARRCAGCRSISSTASARCAAP